MLFGQAGQVRSARAKPRCGSPLPAQRQHLADRWVEVAVERTAIDGFDVVSPAAMLDLHPPRGRGQKCVPGLVVAPRKLSTAPRQSFACDRRGLADPGLDPLATAHAMNAMVSRMASLVFAYGLDMSFDALAEMLLQLWTNALRIPGDSRDPVEDQPPVHG